MLKRIVFLLTSLAMTLSFCSCSDEEEVLMAHSEFRLPLATDFYEITDENYDLTYTNGKYTVAVLRISFVAAIREGIAETMTPYEFAEFWLERCERSANVISGDVTYCEYYDSDFADYFYLEAFYRSPYAYFVVLFATDSALEDVGRVDFLSYAEAVYFTD